MVVGREVDSGEGYIAEQASRRASVQADKTEVLNDPHSAAAGNISGFGNFALDLQTDLHNFERVCKDLTES